MHYLFSLIIDDDNDEGTYTNLMLETDANSLEEALETFRDKAIAEMKEQ